MPRVERFAPAGVPIHVTQRGNFRGSVFRNELDYRLLLELLGRYTEEYGNRVAGYCLMPNHLHLVVIPRWDCGVSEMMRAMTGKYSRLMNEPISGSQLSPSSCILAEDVETGRDVGRQSRDGDSPIG